MYCRNQPRSCWLIDCMGIFWHQSFPELLNLLPRWAAAAQLRRGAVQQNARPMCHQSAGSVSGLRSHAMVCHWPSMDTLPIRRHAVGIALLCNACTRPAERRTRPCMGCMERRIPVKPVRPAPSLALLRTGGLRTPVRPWAARPSAPKLVSMND